VKGPRLSFQDKNILKNCYLLDATLEQLHVVAGNISSTAMPSYSQNQDVIGKEQALLDGKLEALN
jgi:hypothetical protein